MPKRRNPEAADRWGVYVKDNLAYVSTSKLDANKAASKLRLSGRVGIKQKKVGPNPISGKVPKVGWREQYKKAAYTAVKAPKARRERAATTAKIRRSLGKRNPSPSSGKYAVGYNKERRFQKKSDAKKYIRSLGVKVMPIFTYDRQTGNWQLFEYYGSDYYKRNPGRSRGASERAVAGRVGRSISQYARTHGYQGRDAGIGTRAVAAGGRLRNPNVRLMYGTKAQLPKLRILAKADALRTGKTVLIATQEGKVLARITPQSAKPKSNPRKRNAASILRRRNSRKSNPDWPVRVSLYRTGSKPYRTFSYEIPNLTAGSVREAALFGAERAEPGDRVVVWSGGDRLGTFRIRRHAGLPAISRIGKKKKNPSTRRTPRTAAAAMNPGKKGYVVQVGDVVAWVGGLAKDAQKAMKKLMDAGFQGVKGFEAVLKGKGVKKGWRKRFLRVGRSKNPKALNPAFGKGKLGSGSRFSKCVRTMRKRKGVYDPEGLCASIGRRKYGEKKMASLARKGRKSNPRKRSGLKKYVVVGGGAGPGGHSYHQYKRTALDKAKSLAASTGRETIVAKFSKQEHDKSGRIVDSYVPVLKVKP